MQNTSETWRSLWASGSARLEARTLIGTGSGTYDTYTDITAPVISRALMPEGLSVGNAVSASCAFSLRAPGTIPKAAAVRVQKRLTDGVTASEWLAAGEFFISRRRYDPVTGRLSLECYDAMLKANAVWQPSAGTWPRQMAAVALELAQLIGAALDARTVIRTGAAYAMDAPETGTTVREALGRIAAVHGGNWIVTPEGALRLVPLVDAARDRVDVAGVLGRMDAGEVQPITGVRCATEDGTFLAGSEDGAVVTLNNGLPAWAAELAEALDGQTWRRFELSGAVYDPAAEPGDLLRAGAEGEMEGVLCADALTLGALARGDARAPGPDEVADEYPYIGASARTLRVAKAYADAVSAEAAQALDDDLTQQEIFDRLTGNGAAQGLLLVNGQLYVNASYINTGTLSADRIRGGTLVLGGNAGQYGSIEVYDAANAMIGTWGYNSLRVLGQRGISVGRTATGQLHSEINKDYFRLELADEDVDSVVAEIATLLDASTGTRICRISSGNGENESSERIELRSKAVRIAPHGSAQAIGVSIEGNLAISGSLSIGNRTGVSGSFTTAGGKAVTVTNGIITYIDE